MSHIYVGRGRVYQGRVYQGRVYQGRVYHGRVYHGRVYHGRVYQGRVYQGRVYQGGRRGESGGYVTRHCDFPKRTQKFSQASIAILKALGSDKSSVKFESLICLPRYYLNRK